ATFCARVARPIRATDVVIGYHLRAGLLPLGWSGAPEERPQVETILAKPNYRHQKKQKEQARKLRQAEKQSRRMAARADARGTADPEGSTVATETPATGQAET